MGTKEDQVLRAAKEVVVKFIEVGRISPANFSETFQIVYRTIDDQVRGGKSEPSVADEKR